MTLLSRRKLRTTARRITPATLAANIAAVLTLCAAPAIAQPPGYSPMNPQPGYPSANAQPGYTQPQGYPPNYPQGYQPLNYQGSSANSPGANQPTNQKPGMLPLPPGYRPRTVPPQHRPAPATPTASTGGGTVMYFQKPADALTATGGDGSTVGAVAQANVPDRGPNVAVPDAVASALPPPPPPPPSRYLPANTALNPPPAVVIPALTPVSNGQADPQPAPVVQPEPPTVPIAQPYTAKKANPIPAVPDEYIKLPPRENVFMVYDNLQLEKAIMERLREDLKKDKKYSGDQERYLVFPPLPIISPPGVAYQAKTVRYAPKQAILEPNYLVHRRLYFEEKNAERTGWDWGPLQVLVSAGYFWRDTLLVPQTMASGCVYGFWDTSAGKCFPGSPSPYFLYPPGLTVTGGVAEGIAITGLSFIFP